MKSPSNSSKTHGSNVTASSMYPDYIQYSIDNYDSLTNVVCQSPYVVYFVSEQNKAQGNEHFNKKEMQQALHFYLLAIACYRYYCPQKKAVVNERGTLIKCKEICALVLSLLKVLFLNTAAVYLKSANPELAILSCDEALKLDTSNVKALYRKAKAYMHFSNPKIENMVQAIECLEMALKIEPEHPEIVSTLQKAKQKHNVLRSSDAKQKLLDFTNLYKSPIVESPKNEPEVISEAPAQKKPTAAPTSVKLNNQTDTERSTQNFTSPR